MKKFYLVYPLMFGDFFAKAKDIKIFDYLFFYDEENKKYFWIFVANYTMLPEQENLYFKIPFLSDSAEILISDTKSGRGNFIKCLQEEELKKYKQIQPADISVLSITKFGNIVNITASGTEQNIHKYDGVEFVFAKLEVLFIGILKQRDKQIELHKEHLKFV